MRSTKHWIFGALILAALAGTSMLPVMSTSQAQPPPPGAGRGDYWRHNNGRWDYWHEGDKRWYHTDGRHWYYNEGNAWRPYRFDRGFGRTGFERSGYAVPADGATIVVPAHPVYVPR